MDKNFKQYIGDSVYADFDGYGITLTTENGGPPSNTIYLEPPVLRALEQYVEWLRSQQEHTGLYFEQLLDKKES